MNFRRIQGWALVVSAVIALLSLIGSNASFFRLLNLVGVLLFIIGVPAIHSVQPTGITGLIGLILLELAAIISLGVSFMFMVGSSSLNSAVPLTSALAGFLGRAIVGWLTTQRKVFPAWVGWAFILEGLLNLGGGLDLGPMSSAIGIVALLLGAGALIGYGLGIAGNKS